ncbi:hypothetical protein BDZ45DRAFT_682592 [Acephala macrosclerotiorum]|nr:hypothetical protein BDZ45DRAFT_682592 [Acephala macrosclerotiorum]
MRLSQTPPSLLSLLLVALSQINTVNAGPFPKDSLHDLLGLGWLQPRDCASYCGAQNQYCCTAGQACYTNAANVAYCSAGAAVSGYGVYTTTWTETDLVTRTSTYSSYYQVATTTQTWASASTYTAAPAICTTSLGESSCGTICCAENQQCAFAGSCTAYTSTYIATSTYSAPLRPTSGGVSTQTSVVSATTTAPFIPPATASGSTLPITSSSSSGLSGGAIAGIVIGTIAGVILLLLICFCCIVKAGFDGLLALFGLGKRRDRRDRTERVEVIERYSRHGSGAGSRRDQHTGWFGGGGRPVRVTESRRTEKKSSGFGGLGMVGAGLLGLAAILGLKRREDRKAKSSAARSDISSSYYTDSYTGTSASSASSDRRTRESRGTRASRHTSRR